MNIVEAEQNLKKIIATFSKETFVFDLMAAYDFPKSTISKLKIKLIKNPDDDVIVASKLHFVAVLKKELDTSFDELLKGYVTVKKQPRFIIVTDYQLFKAYDTKTGEKLETDIKSLSKHPDFFLPWLGIEKKIFQGENPADVKAAEKLAKFFDLILQDNLKLVEKNRHALNVFLTRILFCFFAEDTDIFEKDLFTKSINDHTNKDGSDLTDYLKRLFEVLNKKSRNGLPDFLKLFPYVNGGLFAEELPIPKFSKRSRESLIDLGSDLNWAEINPDIFGSMIQAVVHPDQRSGLGMHYTSVTNIMKVIEPLFLSELKEEFATAKGSKPKLKKLFERISKIKIFDPACGSGNFLIIAYKELRLLEMDILKTLGEIPMSGISLSNFYGIEIDDFAHEVAKLSLWLAEHQMDVLFNSEFGEVKASLPLKDSGRIVCKNASQIKWEDVCKIKENDEVYLLGNPPYLGSSLQSDEQKEDLSQVCSKKIKDYKNLDYIALWFVKAVDFLKQSIQFKGESAFVTTSSICQGEQVPLLWPYVLAQNIGISFSHAPFLWSNSAKNKAAVFCIIVGIRQENRTKPKFIFSKNVQRKVTNINPYLIEGKNIIVSKQNKPLSNLPEMTYGNKAVDGGNLILSSIEKDVMLKEFPQSKKFIKKLIGSSEFIRGEERFCLWIEDNQLQEALMIPPVNKRIQEVKKMRLASKDDGAKKLAERPHQFRDFIKAKESALIIPRVSSERRSYIPIGFLSPDTIILDSAQAIYDCDPFIFGVISSRIHLLWVKTVSGRLKNDYRYSSVISYNTFPVKKITDTEKERIKKQSFKILHIREKFSNKSISELYDPDLMPDELLKAHQELDSLVEQIYIPNELKSDEQILEYFFNEFQRLVSAK